VLLKLTKLMQLWDAVTRVARSGRQRAKNNVTYCYSMLFEMCIELIYNGTPGIRAAPTTPLVNNTMIDDLIIRLLPYATIA
jgi:hypothetical protein